MGWRYACLELSYHHWASLRRCRHVRGSRRLVHLSRRCSTDPAAIIGEPYQFSNWNHGFCAVWGRVHCSVLATDLVSGCQRCFSSRQRDHDTAFCHIAAHRLCSLRRSRPENRLLPPRSHWRELSRPCRSNSDVNYAPRHTNGKMHRISGPTRNRERLRDATGELSPLHQIIPHPGCMLIVLPVGNSNPDKPTS